MPDQAELPDDPRSSLQVAKLAAISLIGSLVGLVCLGLMCRPAAPSSEATVLDSAASAHAPADTPADSAPALTRAAKFDLLTKINVKTGVITGQAKFADGKLQMDERYVRSLVTIPTKLPHNYDLEVLVAREIGNDAFILGLNIQGQPCMLTVDGFPRAGHLTAIYEIDHRAPDHWEFTGPRHKGLLIQSKKPTRLALKVRASKYWLTVDGVEVLSGDMQGKTLSRPRYYTEPPADAPFIGSYESRFVIEQLTLHVSPEI